MRKIKYRRKPTEGEIKFGYGCTHYIDLPISQVSKAGGGFKTWVVVDGLRYTRV